MSECEWTFYPERWESQFDIDPVSDRKDCHLDAEFDHNGTSYCRYHCPPTTRRNNGTTGEEVFYDLIKEQDEVIAPVFQTISIEESSIGGNSPYIKLIHPIIEDKLYIQGCEFESEFEIIGGVVGESWGSQSYEREDVSVEIIDPKTEQEISISDSRINGEFSGVFRSFDGSFTLSNVDIHGDSLLRGEFVEKVDLSGSDFGNTLCIRNSVFDEGLSLDKCTFWTSLAITDCEISGTLDIAPISTQYLVYVSNTEIETIDEQIRGSSDSLVRIFESTVSSGIIRQPDAGNTLFDFDKATLGDLQIEHSETDLRLYRFRDTMFKGFRFQQMENELIASDWNLHSFEIDTLETNVALKCHLSGSASSIPDRLYADSFEIRNNVETYIEAKRRSQEIGDNLSASEFFIKEMDARQAKRKHRLATSSISNKLRVKLRVAQFRDLILDWSCAFGERPLRIVGWMIAIPFLFGVTLFPGLGGVTNPQTGQQYAFSLSGSLDIALGANTLLKNLYFSYASFATISTAQLRPGSDDVQILMVFSALLGPILISLFVYTLGKQIGR